MQLGPNMRRLREMDVADTLTVRVLSGPGDLMTWEVSACQTSDGIPFEVIGRGTDLEMAAGSAMAILTENGSAPMPGATDGVAIGLQDGAGMDPSASV